MSEVKRYDPMGYDRLSGYMQQHHEGDYVRHADYAALEAECERLRKDRSACWAEFKVMTRSCLDAEKERNAAIEQRDKLAGLLREAEPHVKSSAAASHMFDGFRPRRNSLDDLCERIDAALSEPTP